MTPVTPGCTPTTLEKQDFRHFTSESLAAIARGTTRMHELERGEHMMNAKGTLAGYLLFDKTTSSANVG